MRTANSIEEYERWCRTLFGLGYSFAEVRESIQLAHGARTTERPPPPMMSEEEYYRIQQERLRRSERARLEREEADRRRVQGIINRQLAESAAATARGRARLVERSRGLYREAFARVGLACVNGPSHREWMQWASEAHRQREERAGIEMEWRARQAAKVARKEDRARAERLSRARREAVALNVGAPAVSRGPAPRARGWPTFDEFSGFDSLWGLGDLDDHGVTEDFQRHVMKYGIAAEVM